MSVLVMRKVKQLVKNPILIRNESFDQTLSEGEFSENNLYERNVQG